MMNIIILIIIHQGMNAIQNGLKTVEEYNQKFGLRQTFLEQLMSAMDTPVKGSPVVEMDTAETGKISRNLKRKAEKPGPASTKNKVEKMKK